jgi:hypothetical protein
MTRWPPPHHLASYTTQSDANRCPLGINPAEPDFAPRIEYGITLTKKFRLSV